MRTAKWILATVACGGLAYAAAEPGAFRSESIDAQYGSMGGLRGYVRPGSARDVKLPANASEAKVGEIYASGSSRTIAYAVFASPDGKSQCVVIDANRDRDLSNDAVITVPVIEGSRVIRPAGKPSAPNPVPEAVLDFGGHKETFRVHLYGNASSPMVSLMPTRWMAGETVLGGKRLRAALLDRNHDGTFGAGDYLFLDLNGNGRFDRTYGAAENEVCSLASYLQLGGTYYVPRVARDGTSLAFEPYGGKTGQFQLTGAALEHLAGCRLHLMLRKGTDSSMFTVTTAANAPVGIPVGVYQGVYGSIMAAPAANGTAPVNAPYVGFTVSTVTITEGLACALELAKPRMDLSITQQGNTLSVGLTTTAPGGLTYSQIQSQSNSNRKGPAVVVARAAKPDEAIASGNMEYG